MAENRKGTRTEQTVGFQATLGKLQTGEILVPCYSWLLLHLALLSHGVGWVRLKKDIAVILDRGGRAMGKSRRQSLRLKLILAGSPGPLSRVSRALKSVPSTSM